MSDHGGESVIDSYIDLFLAGNNIPHRKLLGWYCGIGMERESKNWLVFIEKQKQFKERRP